MTLLDPLLPALARPWFDAIALPLVTRTYMPLSRAWTAAAGAVEGLSAGMIAITARVTVTFELKKE